MHTLRSLLYDSAPSYWHSPHPRLQRIQAWDEGERVNPEEVVRERLDLKPEGEKDNVKGWLNPQEENRFLSAISQMSEVDNTLRSPYSAARWVGTSCNNLDDIRSRTTVRHNL